MTKYINEVEKEMERVEEAIDYYHLLALSKTLSKKDKENLIKLEYELENLKKELLSIKVGEKLKNF